MFVINNIFNILCIYLYCFELEKYNLGVIYIIYMDYNNRFNKNFILKKSNIHGLGIHSNKNIKKNQIIGVTIYYIYYFFPIITTDLGKWLNHSYNPNSFLYYSPENKIYYLIANQYISKDTEITVDYRHTPWFIKKPEPHYK